MAKVSKVARLHITMPNKVGLLAQVCAAIAGAKVNIQSVCAYETEGKGHMLLTCDSPANARKALAGLGGSIDESQVLAVEMPNKPGELQMVADRLASAGINIAEAYGCPGTGRSGVCIIKTADDERAARLITG
jgi:hypothetical protein